MNNKRRKSLLIAINLLEQALSVINSVKDEENDSLENIPESLQYGEAYDIMEQNIDKLEDISSTIEEISTELGSL